MFMLAPLTTVERSVNMVFCCDKLFKRGHKGTTNFGHMQVFGHFFDE